MITFRYFRHPHTFSTYTSEPSPCDLCQCVRPGFEGPFYDREDLTLVCEECLLEGGLIKAGASTNDADVSSLRKQLQELMPLTGKEELEEIVSQRTKTVVYCTPTPTTWQDFYWPAHCGDYACFLKEIGKEDLIALDPNGDGESFLCAHMYHRVKGCRGVREVWRCMRAETPGEKSDCCPVGVYLFQCLHCRDYIILWDCD